MLTFTPNSYGVRALPLEMHSTSGACNAYRLQGTNGKNDANDAAAICEAASRPTMRFVPIKTVSQQGMLRVHRLREGLKEERTACINRIRPNVLSKGLSEMIEDADNDLPGVARMVIERARSQWQEIDAHIDWCDARINAHIENDEQARIATQLVGVGPSQRKRWLEALLT